MGYEAPSYESLIEQKKHLEETYSRLNRLYQAPIYDDLKRNIPQMNDQYIEKVNAAGKSANTMRVNAFHFVDLLLKKLPFSLEAEREQARYILLGALFFGLFIGIDKTYDETWYGFFCDKKNSHARDVFLDVLTMSEANLVDSHTVYVATQELQTYLEGAPEGVLYVCRWYVYGELKGFYYKTKEPRQH